MTEGTKPARGKRKLRNYLRWSFKTLIFISHFKYRIKAIPGKYMVPIICKTVHSGFFFIEHFTPLHSYSPSKGCALHLRKVNCGKLF